MLAVEVTTARLKHEYKGPCPNDGNVPRGPRSGLAIDMGHMGPLQLHHVMVPWFSRGFFMYHIGSLKMAPNLTSRDRKTRAKKAHKYNKWAF